MKKAPRQTVIGEAGVALIARRVSEMGHLWHPTSGADSGIDGEIELRDPAAHEVRNFRIGVQSKATEGRWRSETDAGFLYRVTPDDIEYWLGSNQPVLLVCSRPHKDEAYWRNIQEWGRDPERRASGLVEFDKSRDRFDGAAAARFFTLDAREPVALEPPGPLQQSERMLSNLLPVRWDTDHLWAVDAPAPEWGEIFQRALAAGVARTDVALRDGRLWSLAPFSEQYASAIGAKIGSTDRLDLGRFVDASDSADRNLVAELARRTLLSDHHRDLRWSNAHRFAYFRLIESRPERKFRWGRGPGRTVVLPRKSSNHEGLSGYRHDAAELAFRRLGGAWFMAISPTYLFTHDGQKPSSFHADALKKMKEMDRSQAVSQQIRMWASLFTQPMSVLDGDPPPFHFGGLAQVSIDVSPPEAAWNKAPDDIRADDLDLPTLFDPPGTEG